MQHTRIIDRALKAFEMMSFFGISLKNVLCKKASEVVRAGHPRAIFEMHKNRRTTHSRQSLCSYSIAFIKSVIMAGGVASCRLSEVKFLLKNMNPILIKTETSHNILSSPTVGTQKVAKRPSCGILRSPYIQR